jgi:23S rRNA (uridine2552-2'-O)-methyltransferase
MPPRKRELHDSYFRKAKEEGYVARSAYKLLQIQERRHLIRPGNWVIDLGCAPGSWLQVCSRTVGPTGRVLGIDLSPVSIEKLPNVKTLVGDVFAVTPRQLESELGGVADVVISDMAPNTTGAPQGDHFRSIALCRRVLEMLPILLRHRGNLVMKVFEGEAYPELLRETQELFDDARGYKPDATRDVSREMFIMAHGYRKPAPSPAALAEPGDSPFAGRIPPHKRENAEPVAPVKKKPLPRSRPKSAAAAVQLKRTRGGKRAQRPRSRKAK